MLNNVLKKDYPNLEVEFYLLRRSKFVHMGLDVSLFKIQNREQLMILKNYGMIKNKMTNSFSVNRI